MDENSLGFKLIFGATHPMRALKFVNRKTWRKLLTFKARRHGKEFTVRYDEFWEAYNEDIWEEDTFYVFDTFLKQDRSYIDIGAWAGPTVLYGCQLAKHCFAIEPDPIAFRMLSRNVELNPSLKDKITLFRGALSDVSGTLRLNNKKGFGDSMSTISSREGAKSSVSVEALSFDDYLKKFRIEDCNFIKIDTEGAETRILPGMRDYILKNKPTICLALHPFLFEDENEDSEKLMNIIREYSNIYEKNGRRIDLKTVRDYMKTQKVFDIVLTEDEMMMRSD